MVAQKILRFSSPPYSLRVKELRGNENADDALTGIYVSFLRMKLI